MIGRPQWQQFSAGLVSPEEIVPLKSVDSVLTPSQLHCLGKLQGINKKTEALSAARLGKWYV